MISEFRCDDASDAVEDVVNQYTDVWTGVCCMADALGALAELWTHFALDIEDEGVIQISDLLFIDLVDEIVQVLVIRRAPESAVVVGRDVTLKATEKAGDVRNICVRLPNVRVERLAFKVRAIGVPGVSVAGEDCISKISGVRHAGRARHAGAK